MLSPNGMKTLKVFHLIFIMMWVVGIMAIAFLYWRPSSSSLEFLYNQQTSDFIDYVLVIPGATCAVITGIIYGLKTKWGFFKHPWLTVKWILGIAIIIFGTFVLHPISLDIIAEATPKANEGFCFPTDYFGPRHMFVKVMSVVQALLLLFLVYVSVFKPWKKKG